MNLTITTEQRDKYVCNTISGIVSVERFFDYVLDHYKNWASQPVLWDLTNAQIENSTAHYETLKRYMGMLDAVLRTRIGFRTAIAAPPEVVFGLFRIITKMIKHRSSQYDSTVYRSVYEAEAWLLGEALV